MSKPGVLIPSIDSTQTRKTVTFKHPFSEAGGSVSSVVSRLSKGHDILSSALSGPAMNPEPFAEDGVERSTVLTNNRLEN
jgi:hypothetical protein